MNQEEANRVMATPPRRRKASPLERQRMQLVLAAFNAGVEQIKRVRAGKLPKEEGTWWPEMAPLSPHERRLVWQYIGQHFKPQKG